MSRGDWSNFYFFPTEEMPKPLTTSEYLLAKLHAHIEQVNILIEITELLKDSKVRRYIDLVQKVKD